MADEITFELDDEETGTEDSEFSEGADEQAQDEGQDDHDAETPTAASGEEKPKLTGKARAAARAADYKALKQQNAELARQMAEMSRAVQESARASQMAAEAQTRSIQGQQKPWEQVADEKIAAALAAVKEGDQASIQNYHKVLREVAQEGARIEAQRVQQQIQASQPRPPSPLQQEIQSAAPWITDPGHNAAVQRKVDQLFASRGMDPRSASDKVFVAVVKEAIAHYAAFAGLQTNLPKPPPGNVAAVSGAGARSFGGGGAAAPDASQLSPFMRDFADQMFPDLPPAKRYATYMKQVVQPELQKRR